MLKGTLLAESLRIGATLDVAGLRVTRLSRRDVSASVSASQPSVWTFLDFEAGDDLADTLARSPADALLADGGWYADFTVGGDHVVVFAGKIFRYRRGDQSGRASAADYGRTVGVPDHQLDWTDRRPLRRAQETAATIGLRIRTSGTGVPPAESSRCSIGTNPAAS